ncbi:MBL fold metallo-hydrolase [Paenisporosarcina cavernae]|uniref:MBL fold metallo-hydrolase n=1 Tax=Paenisporosarcina cavernae TaxID=2320858 RepID=A0A385YV49_9BACL|nr:MBL fold metallo-hydrolase [Paenisporosarcina cavernae]AYC29568.1 MBL fold metallo-hydrolase [Paenisporosarcina cavernae]
MYSIRTYPLGWIQTNCYIVSNASKKCVVIDPGGNGEKLVKELTRLQLTPVAILLTHAHFDHVGAVEFVRTKWGIPLYLHKKEKDWLEDPMKNGSGHYAELPNITTNPADHLITEEGTLSFDDIHFQLLFTPGHSPGSITYVLVGENIAFVGDTLFKGSIGRTDLLGGNTQQLLDSIHQKLLPLEEDTICYSGHGEPTTIGAEIETNPFLNGFN